MWSSVCGIFDPTSDYLAILERENGSPIVPEYAVEENECSEEK